MSNTQCPILNIQYSMSNTQCPILNVQYSISNTQCPILNVQYSMSNTQCPILNVQYSMSNTQCPILNTQYSMMKAGDGEKNGGLCYTRHFRIFYARFCFFSSGEAGYVHLIGNYYATLHLSLRSCRYFHAV
jgi:hypothetical protein